ncbi:methyl-accepting chemotaxis protein [Paenibacillus pinihumi]|uniref:methyl-accepting chemotaxis protein n=1 Tax=Paenibacillus pinihumi TaxID=669462 RepID=UPI000429D5C6|nr:methyl-accepting chemotaxis protein [Paenibacillus pinihumi]
MRWYYNLKTSTKLISAFLILAALMAGVGMYSLTNLKKMNNSLDDMYANQLMAVRSILEAKANLNEMRMLLRRLYMSTDESKLQSSLDTAKSNREEIEAGLAAFRETNLSKTSAELLPALEKAMNDYFATYDETLRLHGEGKMEEMLDKIDNDVNQKVGVLNPLLNQLLDTNVKEADQSRDNGVRAYTSSRNIMVGVIILVILLSVALGTFISRSISAPLSRVVKLLSKVAHGDLREKAEIRTKDEIGALGVAIDQMIVNLSGIVTGVIESAKNLSSSAQQISATSEEIAGGNANQAEAAQTISELFRELTDAIQSVAQNTEQAAELSEETVEISKAGGQVIDSSLSSMEEASSKMSRLEDDSRRIGDIIEVIEDIADQTNLLALNAAIEAARAGEQGRGFAVVADEVRKLAERSSEATKQITGIIKGMQENTRESVIAVKESGVYSQKTNESFGQISSNIVEAGHKVSEIAAASEEQAAQASNVMEAVESISAATEQAAAASQEAAAIAQSMAQLAEELEQSVSVFKV